MIGIAEQIKEVYKNYTTLQNRLYALLSKQMNTGGFCDCENPEKITLPEAPLTKDFCAQCGGTIDEN